MSQSRWSGSRLRCRAWCRGRVRRPAPGGRRLVISTVARECGSFEGGQWSGSFLRVREMLCLVARVLPRRSLREGLVVRHRGKWQRRASAGLRENTKSFIHSIYTIHNGVTCTNMKQSRKIALTSDTCDQLLHEEAALLAVVGVREPVGRRVRHRGWRQLMAKLWI